MGCDCSPQTDGGIDTGSTDTERTDTERTDTERTDTERTDTEPTDVDGLDTPLPGRVADAFATAFARDPARSLRDWTALLPEVFPEWPPAVESLCHDPDGAHRATTPDADYRFVCVLDALLLPALTDDAVTVESSPPVGDDLTIDVAPDGTTDAPAGAVVSFGALPHPPDGDVTAEHTYGAICPAIHAFPSLAAYEQWDASSAAETTPLSVDRAVALAGAMVAAGD